MPGTGTFYKENWTSLNHFVFHLSKKGAGADPIKSAPDHILNWGPAPVKKPRLWNTVFQVLNLFLPGSGRNFFRPWIRICFKMIRIRNTASDTDRCAGFRSNLNEILGSKANNKPKKVCFFSNLREVYLKTKAGLWICIHLLRIQI